MKSLDMILSKFDGKKILVTGGTGMIGRHIVDILIGTGANVKVVSLDKIKISNKPTYIYGDLIDFNFCKEITSGMDFVFHIAGIGASVKSAKTRIASHFVPMLQMNTNMIEACRLNEVEKTVFTSSVGAYSEAEVFVESEYKIDSIPMDFAGWAKRMTEAQILAYKKEYGLENFAVVRLPNVFGPGDNFHPDHALVIPSLMYRIYHGENPLVIWGDGTSERDFLYAKDAAIGVILALWHGTAGGFVNIGSGQTHSISQLVKMLNSFIDFKYEFDAQKPTGVKKRLLDITLAQETIGYEPRMDLQTGLKMTWDWFCANPDQYQQKQCYFED